MNRLKKAFAETTPITAMICMAVWLPLVLFVFPAFAGKYIGESALLRFDPTVSSDYDCIFVEAHAHRSFSVPWLRKKTAAEYVRLRYTPQDRDQHYGIMFVNPQTLAFEAHVGFAESPSALSGNLDAQAVLAWMRSQPRSAQAESHQREAEEVYGAVFKLRDKSLEDFALPSDHALANFEIGHTATPERDSPHWFVALAPLVVAWTQVFSRYRERKKQSKTKMGAQQT